MTTNRIAEEILPSSALETPGFRNGVVAGYHACGNDLVKGLALLTNERLAWLLENKDARPDWKQGFQAAYVLRREQHVEGERGATEGAGPAAGV